MRMLLFESDRFEPFLPDECQVNPNVLGFELAQWLSRELARNGFVTSYPSEEDWGWFLDRAEGDAEYMICCSGEATGNRHSWRIFVARPKGFFQRMTHDSRCDEILEIVERLLADSGIAVRAEDGP